MKRFHIRLPPRDRLVAGLGPSAVALLVLALFVVPNYLHAADARRESRRVDQTTTDHLMKRSQLVALERDLARMSAERSVRCRTIGDISTDRLIDAIVRPVDGRSVRNQSIRLGSHEQLPKSATIQQVLIRRVVTVEMMGSFDAIFAVLDSAENIEQLVVPTRIEFGAVRNPADEDVSVRATIELHGYFLPTGSSP